jgi:hypothetical protein
MLAFVCNERLAIQQVPAKRRTTIAMPADATSPVRMRGKSL